jgi:hypothetical protein
VLDGAKDKGIALRFPRRCVGVRWRRKKRGQLLDIGAVLMASGDTLQRDQVRGGRDSRTRP